MASKEDLLEILQKRLKAQEKRDPNVILSLIDLAKKQKADSIDNSASSALGNYYLSNLNRLRANSTEFPYAKSNYNDVDVIKHYFMGASAQEEEELLKKSIIPLEMQNLLRNSASPAKIALLETDPIVQSILNPTSKEESKSLIDVLKSYF